MKALNKDFFDIQVKSKERVQDFGEVFTPEKYVEQMLDVLDTSVWSDENKVFFEPTCGHGNFVTSILKKRLNSLYKKAKRKNIKNLEFWAVANSINTLWAIDIDQENINETRFRVLSLVFEFLNLKSNKASIELIRGNEIFFIHILSAVDYQIHQNEVMTALKQDTSEARKVSLQTEVSKDWFEKGKHNPIKFDLNWIEYFKNNKTTILFKKKSKFINSLLKQPQQIQFSKRLMNHYFI